MFTTTNIYDLYTYSSITSNNVEKIKELYDLKQHKITGAASSLVSDDTSLSTNLCMFVDTNKKLTVGSELLNVGSDKLALLDGLDKSIIDSIEDVQHYLDNAQIKSQNLIEVVAVNFSNSTEKLLDNIGGIFNIGELYGVNIDELSQGITNKFIVNNIYDGNLIIDGSLITSNLLVKGDTFTVETDVYKTNKVEIISHSDSTTPCLNIIHTESDTNNANILELKSQSNKNAVTISSTGKIGINKDTIPVYSLDVGGIVNIDNGFNFQTSNNKLSFQDLDNIPSQFTPSAHGHTINDIYNLSTTLQSKQDNIDGFSWDANFGKLNIDKNLNLVNGHKFKIDNKEVSSILSSSLLLWTTSLTGIVTRDLINITPYNININNSDYPYNKGIFLNEGNVITYSGDIVSSSVESKNTIINKKMIIGSGDNKWRIYSEDGGNNDLYFESTNDDGNTWSLRAKMYGSAQYSDSVYTNFTGVHHCRASTDNIYDNKYIGYIVSASEQQFSAINSIYSPSNIAKHFDRKSWDFLPVISLSSKAYDKSVFGVIAKVEGTDEHERYEISGNLSFPVKKEEYDRRLHIAGSGEGGIWVCNYKGVLESGDFITTSPISGIGMKQDNDIVCNYTVGKITMDCDFEPKSINSSNLQDTKEYEVKYLNSDGSIIGGEEYVNLQSSNIPVYKMAFVGCSYNCS